MSRDSGGKKAYHRETEKGPERSAVWDRDLEEHTWRGSRTLPTLLPLVLQKHLAGLKVHLARPPPR